MLIIGGAESIVIFFEYIDLRINIVELKVKVNAKQISAALCIRYEVRLSLYLSLIHISEPTRPY